MKYLKIGEYMLLFSKFQSNVYANGDSFGDSHIFAKDI